MADLSDQELLDALGVEVKADKKATHTPREERIIAGFEEIQRFVEEQGRLPAHGEGNDIFERIYATRLDQIRNQDGCRNLLQDLDYQGLLGEAAQIAEPKAEYGSDEELLAELGVETPKEGDITHLKHVKSQAEKKAAEDIASRTPCEDFDKFEKLFKQVKSELDSGDRKTIRFGRDTSIEKGNFFILGGQMAYVADVGETIKAPNGENDARLRVIYANATESDLLMRSLQRALYKDEAGRRITETDFGPLFSGDKDGEDLASGTIYVLRSKSDNPVITKNRDVVHKIGVTGGNVQKRIANAKLDPTFLMADVEVVATYELYKINRSKLENLLHRFFDASRLDIEIKDRFGNPVVPREWFLVPLFVIDEVVEKIKDKTISNYFYETETVSLVPVSTVR